MSFRRYILLYAPIGPIPLLPVAAPWLAPINTIHPSSDDTRYSDPVAADGNFIKSFVSCQIIARRIFMIDRRTVSSARKSFYRRHQIYRSSSNLTKFLLSILPRLLHYYGTQSIWPTIDRLYARAYPWTITVTDFETFSTELPEARN